MPTADVTWIDVLPSMRGFLPALTKELRNSVPQAGRMAGQDFGQAFARSSASGVEAASRSLVQANRKVEDATGRVRVAQAKLDEVRQKSKATTSQVAQAEENLAKAQRQLDAAQDESAASAKKLATAQEQQATAAKQAGDGMEHARRRGGVLSGLMDGLRRNVLLSVGAFVGFTEVVRFVNDAIGAASDLQESVTKVGVVFGDSADEVLSFSRTTARSLGQSQRQALEATGTFGNLFRAIGLTEDASADMSIQLVKLASDLASFNNTSPADALEALRSGLVGETEPLRRFGINLSDAALRQEALNLGIYDGTGALNASQRAQAAYALILDQSKLAQGDFARTSDGLANQQRILSAEWDEAKVKLGQLLVGPMQGLVGLLTDGIIPAFDTVVSVVGGAIDLFRDLPGPIQATALAIGAARVALALLHGPLSGVGPAFAGMWGKIQAGARATATTLTTQAGVMATAGATARAGWAGLMRILGGPVGLAITAVTLAIPALVRGFQSITGASDDAKAAQETFAQALRETGGAINDTARDAARQALVQADLVRVFDDAGISARDAIDGLLGNAAAQERVNAALQDYITHSGPAGVARTSETEAARVARNDYQALAGTLSATRQEEQFFAQASRETTQATEEQSTETTELEQNLDALEEQTNENKSAIDRFKLSLDALTGQSVTLTDAEFQLSEALLNAKERAEDMTGAVLDNTGQLNQNTEAGIETWKQLLSIRDAGNQLIATMIAQGATSEQVRARDAQLRQSFYDTALQMTGSQTEADRLTTAILGIPDSRTTTINADTGPADAAVAAFTARVNGRVVALTGDFAPRPGVAVRNAEGNVLTPMPGGIGRIVKPNTWRIVGDRMRDDEAYIPINDSVRSQALLEQTARRMGHALVPAGWDPQARAGALALDNGAILHRSYTIPVHWTPPSDAKIDAVINAVLGGGVPGNYAPPTHGGFARALAWARTQVGKPYIWGGVGPRGYDCSGFMSAITNVIRGRGPHSRIGATATFPWPGFRPGNGAFTIGSFRGNPGHMAGTLLGVNVESSGGVGVRVGGGARGAWDRMFRTRAALFDDGGMWPSGLVGLNETGGIERVLTPEQDDSLDRYLRDGHGDVAISGGRSLIDTVNISMVESNPYRVLEELDHQLRVADMGGRYAWTTG